MKTKLLRKVRRRFTVEYYNEKCIKSLSDKNSVVYQRHRSMRFQPNYSGLYVVNDNKTGRIGCFMSKDSAIGAISVWVRKCYKPKAVPLKPELVWHTVVFENKGLRRRKWLLACLMIGFIMYGFAVFYESQIFDFIALLIWCPVLILFAKRREL